MQVRFQFLHIGKEMKFSLAQNVARLRRTYGCVTEPWPVLGSDPTFHARDVKNSARDFLNGKFGRINVRYVVFSKYLLCFEKLVTNLLRR